MENALTLQEIREIRESLVRDGLVRDSGKRRRDEIVWEVPDDLTSEAWKHWRYLRDLEAHRTE